MLFVTEATLAGASYGHTDIDRDAWKRVHVYVVILVTKFHLRGTVS